MSIAILGFLHKNCLSRWWSQSKGVGTLRTLDFKSSRTLLSIIATLALVTSLLIPSMTSSLASVSITDADERFKVEMPQDDGWHGARFDNTFKDWSLPSQLVAFKGSRTPGNVDQAVCLSLDDPACLKDGWRMYVRALFDQCKSDRDRDCIISLEAIKSDGTRVALKEKEVLTTRHAFTGDAKQLIPDGTGAGIWTLNDGGSSLDFALISGVELNIKDVVASRAANNDSYVSRTKMLFALQPVEIVRGLEYREPVMAIENNVLVGNGDAFGKGCFVAASGYCALTKTFPQDLTFELKTRFRKGVPGWLVGRVANLKISGQELASRDGFDFTITGKASVISEVLAWSKWKDTSQQVRDLYSQGVDGVQWRPDKSQSEVLNPDPESRTLLTYLNEAGEKSIRHFNAWLPLISDKATTMRTKWNLQTVEDPSGTYKKCGDGKGLLGAITSNASVYSDGPPIFNESAGTLEYKVAAPHYMKDGSTKMLGRYDLAMRSDVARCLYGFSNAPITATISIESDGGTNIVSTESVTEQNGILRLSASGFTFSSPTIKVKLTQGNSSQSASKPVKKTITCVKGSTKKKITGTNPKCPQGFKRA